MAKTSVGVAVREARGRDLRAAGKLPQLRDLTQRQRPIDRPKLVVLILAHGGSAGGDVGLRMWKWYCASNLQPRQL